MDPAKFFYEGKNNFGKLSNLADANPLHNKLKNPVV